MDRFWKWKLDHVCFWLITVGFHIYTRLYIVETAGWGLFISEIVIRNGALALIIYANLEYLIPDLAQRNRSGAYVLGLAIGFTFYVLVKNTHDYFLNVLVGQANQSFWQHSFYNFSIALFYLAFSLALHLSKEWYFQRKRLQQIELEKLHTELAYLKAQINPHFLFNSLNTIFFQIDKSNTVARETLTKFSDMLRFQLYECNGHVVPIEREVAYLQNYVDLQRLRKDQKYAIDFQVVGTVRDQPVAPLLFMPLIENAFKHLSHFPEGGNRVKIQLECGPNQVELQVENTKESRIERSEKQGGIGLKNLQRRLELQYKDRYELEVTETKREFVARLKVMA